MGGGPVEMTVGRNVNSHQKPKCWLSWTIVSVISVEKNVLHILMKQLYCGWMLQYTRPVCETSCVSRPVHVCKHLYIIAMNHDFMNFFSPQNLQTFAAYLELLLIGILPYQFYNFLYLYTPAQFWFLIKFLKTTRICLPMAFLGW